MNEDGPFDLSIKIVSSFRYHFKSFVFVVVPCSALKFGRRFNSNVPGTVVTGFSRRKTRCYEMA